MTPQMTPEPKISSFSWYELHTPDASLAADFYTNVLEWKTRDAGSPNGNYTLASVGDIPVAGFLQKPAASFASGEKPRWIGYIGVDNAQAFSQRVVQAGGIIHKPAEEIPGIGTFAVVADPEGVVFTLFQPPPGITPPEPPAPCTTGMPNWHELTARNWQAEWDFYAGLFGWTKVQAMDMGGGNIYQLFSTGAQPVGGMLNAPKQATSPAWLFYFYVAEINAAIDRIKQHCGTLLNGPMPIPGDALVAHCLDSQGAMFAIVGPAKK